MKKSSVKIHGDTWKIFKVSAAEMSKKSGPSRDYRGLTDITDFSITFVDDSCDEATIVHELVHVYTHYLCLTSTTTMSMDDLEEVFCEMFALNFKKINANMKEIKRKLK